MVTIWPTEDAAPRSVSGAARRARGGLETGSKPLSQSKRSLQSMPPPATPALCPYDARCLSLHLYKHKRPSIDAAASRRKPQEDNALATEQQRQGVDLDPVCEALEASQRQIALAALDGP